MRRGHTLFEVLAVMAILGLVCFFVLQPYSQHQKAVMLNATGQSLAGELKTAQAAARSCHSKEKVALVFAGSRWNLQNISTPVTGPDIIFPVRPLPENINLSTNFSANAVVFNNTGNPSKSGSITVGVTGYDKQRNIVVSPVGRIRVTDAI